MNILWHEDASVEILEVGLSKITTGTVAMPDGTYLLKAGTPLSNAYAVKNDSNAKYIVAEDHLFSGYQAQAEPVKLIKKGYVDINKAQESYGTVYASSAKNALKTAGITLVDKKLSADNTGGISSIPTASASTLGGVKVGTSLAIADGVLDVNPAENQADSTAADVAGLVTDFNALLAKLKAAGFMAPDPEPDPDPEPEPSEE